MASARILDSRPSHGTPRRFGWEQSPSATEPGMLVAFEITGGDSWIGSFAPGAWPDHRSIVESPTDSRCLVLADGNAYLVNADRECVEAQLSEHALNAYWIRDPALIVLNWYGLAFHAYEGAHLRWCTRRVSWDGIEGISISTTTLTAQTWSAPHQSWVPVSIDLRTGKATGGAYDLPDAAEDEIICTHG
jgi:hypothetical protein